MLASSVFAQPPVFQTFEGVKGLAISYPKYEYIYIDSSFVLHVKAFNYSDGLSIGDRADCHLQLYTGAGAILLNDDLPWDDDYHSYTLFIDSGNFSTLGYRSYTILCNTTRDGGFVDGVFMVTETGDKENLKDSTFWYITLGFFFLVVAFLFLIHQYKNEITTVIVYGTMAGVLVLAYMQYLFYRLGIYAFNVTWVLISLGMAIVLYFFMVGATFRRELRERKEDDE